MNITITRVPVANAEFEKTMHITSLDLSNLEPCTNSFLYEDLTEEEKAVVTAFNNLINSKLP